MTGAAGGEQLRGIGARLRAARERKGLTVLQAAEKLHVDPRVLDALEAEDFASLGADVYVRGHLRRYADLTGEDGAQLQELYAAGRQTEHPDLTRIPRTTSPSRSTVLVLPALLLVVALAIAGVVWWALTLPPAERPRTLSPEAALPRATAPAAAPSTGAPAPPAGAAPRTSSTEASVPVANAAGSQLDLRFSGESWVEISDADGRRLLHGLIEAGGARALNGTPPLRVVLGNSPAVALQMNGRPVSIEGLAHRDGSARLLIDAAGHATAAPARLAHGD
jgi:cytoskeleton protein RodZ